jgi:hypothetical protein
MPHLLVRYFIDITAGFSAILVTRRGEWAQFHFKKKMIRHSLDKKKETTMRRQEVNVQKNIKYISGISDS